MSPRLAVADLTPAQLADVIDEVVACVKPALELRDIAAKHEVPLHDLQGRLGMLGYPNKQRLAAAAVKLREQPAPAARPAAKTAAPAPVRHDFDSLEDLPDIDSQEIPGEETAIGEDETATVEEYSPDDAGTGSAPEPDQDANDELGELTRVRITAVHPDPENPRTELKDIDELAGSIKQAGMLQPIVARYAGGKLVMIAGHRRLAAAKQLGWAHVPVIIKTLAREDDVLASMLIENGQRVDLDYVEEARALNTLRIRWDNCSEVELGRRLGRSLNYVNGRLVLLRLTAETQDRLRRGQIGYTAAVQMAKIASGKVRPGAVGRPGVGHLSGSHPLAKRVNARCVRMGHAKGKGTGVGGVGCGACWEAVIRSDERQDIADEAVRKGRCPTCDADVDQQHADHLQEATTGA